MERSAWPPLRVRIRARDIALARRRPEAASFLNVLPARIAALAAEDDTYVDVQLDVGAPLWARVTARSAADLGLQPGAEVYALIKAVAIDAGSVARRRRSAGTRPD
jgi:molybdate transport system ATP-binding protein